MIVGESIDSYEKELLILYRGNKEKKINGEKDSPNFANYLLLFPKKELPLTLLEVFRRYKQIQN